MCVYLSEKIASRGAVRTKSERIHGLSYSGVCLVFRCVLTFTIAVVGVVNILCDSREKPWDDDRKGGLECCLDCGSCGARECSKGSQDRGATLMSQHQHSQNTRLQQCQWCQQPWHWLSSGLGLHHLTSARNCSRSFSSVSAVKLLGLLPAPLTSHLSTHHFLLVASVA